LITALDTCGHARACGRGGRGSYDLHGGWEKVTGEHTALTSKADDTDTVEDGVGNWIKGGAPPSKLVLGLAVYGHGWTLVNKADAGVGAAASGPSQPGPYSNAAGILTYAEIEREFCLVPRTCLVKLSAAENRS